MAGSKMPIAVSHGEGRAEFSGNNLELVQQQQLVTLRYINNKGQVASSYPANPNGSPLGITGLTSADGRATIMMPHPERHVEACVGSDDGRWIFESLLQHFAQTA